MSTMTTISEEISITPIKGDPDVYDGKPELEETNSNDSSSTQSSIDTLQCLTCDEQFPDKNDFHDHLLKHVKQPRVVLQRVDDPVIKKRKQTHKLGPLRFIVKTKNNNFKIVKTPTSPETPKSEQNEPRVPKIRILLPEQLSDTKIGNCKIVKVRDDKDLLNGSIESAFNGQVKNEKMVELHSLPNESQSPGFPSQSPGQPEIADITKENSFWSSSDHVSSGGLQITEGGEKEAETHNSLLQNFLNDTTGDSTSRDLGLNSNDNEYISLDRLAGPKCPVCNERCIDQCSLDIHQKAMGHYEVIARSSNNSLVPYGQSPLSTISNPLDSLSNLPMEQLAQQVNRLQRGQVHQQNVLINIQQFGQPMAHHPQYTRGPEMPPHYPPQQHYGAPQQPPPPPHMFGGYHPPPHAHHPPPHPMYYPQSSGMYPMPPQHDNRGGPPMPHPYSQQQQHPQQQQQHPQQQHAQQQHPQQQQHPTNSMMPPRPPPPPQQRMPQGPPQHMAPPPANTNIPQHRPRPRAPLSQIREQLRAGLPRGPVPRGPGPRMMPPRPGGPQQYRPQPQQQKRSAPDQQQQPQQKQRKRFDVLIPDTNDNDDCHVISMQKCNDGMPIIKNVQGAATPSEEDPVVHLTDSITLSVRNPKDAPVIQQKKNDAKAVANILATRGITVTPTAKNQKEQQQQQAEPKKPPQAATSPPVAINLNNAVSIIPTARGQGKNGAQERSPRSQTVDLTDDNEPIQQLKPPTPPANISKRSLPHQCDLCPAQYPSLQALMNHRRSYHKTGPQTDLGIPVVDLRQPSVLSKLASLGITNYIPLPQLSSGGGTFGLPIVSVNATRNPNICNIGALGSGAVLPLGPLRHVSNLPNNR